MDENMRKSFRESKKEVDRVKKERIYKRDSDGRVIVNMTVEDDDDFLSVFSESSTPVISTEVAEFIENSTHSILPKEELTMRIYSNCIDAEEEKRYAEAIKEHYTEKYIAIERELRRNTLISIVLAVTGVLILSLAILLEFVANSLIWAEVIDIVAWVLLWEAVDISVFEMRSQRLKRMHYLACLSMKIEYYPAKNVE